MQWVHFCADADIISAVTHRTSRAQEAADARADRRGGVPALRRARVPRDDGRRHRLRRGHRAAHVLRLLPVQGGGRLPRRPTRSATPCGRGRAGARRGRRRSRRCACGSSRCCRLRGRRERRGGPAQAHVHRRPERWRRSSAHPRAASRTCCAKASRATSASRRTGCARSWSPPRRSRRSTRSATTARASSTHGDARRDARLPARRRRRAQEGRLTPEHGAHRGRRLQAAAEVSP